MKARGAIAPVLRRYFVNPPSRKMGALLSFQRASREGTLALYLEFGVLAGEVVTR
jgi:hypothetical protein